MDKRASNILRAAETYRYAEDDLRSAAYRLHEAEALINLFRTEIGCDAPGIAYKQLRKAKKVVRHCFLQLTAAERVLLSC